MTSSNDLERAKYQQLQELLNKCQTSDDLQQQESIINQIVAIVLRSRPLCRRFNGTPLKGVYREIYNRVKDRLYNHLQEDLIGFSSQDNIPNQPKTKQIKPAYLFLLQKQLFKQILDDEQLKQMGLAAQKYPVNSELRTYALTELIGGIKLSGRLCRPHSSKFSSSLYFTLYEEAIAETFAYICLNIDLYDPQRGNGKFMNWVNFKLDKLILKSYANVQKYARHEIALFDDLEQTSQSHSHLDLTEILKEYIALDPDRIFTTVHIRNRPDANFSTIALAKFDRRSWEEISAAMGIPIPTLSSFYNRWCRRFTPLFRTEFNKYL